MDKIRVALDYNSNMLVKNTNSVNNGSTRFRFITTWYGSFAIFSDDEKYQLIYNDKLNKMEVVSSIIPISSIWANLYQFKDHKYFYKLQRVTDMEFIILVYVNQEFMILSLSTELIPIIENRSSVSSTRVISLRVRRIACCMLHVLCCKFC